MGKMQNRETPMAKLTLGAVAVVAVVFALIPGVAEAGGGGKRCKHQTFDACFNRCVDLAGGGFFAIKKCSKHCGKRVCPPNG